MIQELQHPVSINKLKQFVLDQYNLKVKIYSLPGELDLNFKLVTEKGKAYVLKLYAPDRDQLFLDFQEKILAHLESKKTGFKIPYLIKTVNGTATSFFVDNDNQLRSVRLLTWISGRLWNQLNPHTKTLRYQLGVVGGKMSKTLSDFTHDFANRTFEWDISKGLWTKAYLHLFDSADQALINRIIQQFENVKPDYDQLKKGVVHNDANDFNVLVSEDVFDPTVVGLIDFGDAVYTQLINDLAICCTYAILNFEDPLEASLPIVKGYHKAYPIEESALQFLYIAIGIRLVISVTKSRINRLEEPDNLYLQISDKAAWNLLRKWDRTDAEFAYYRFREACEMIPHPQFEAFSKWTSSQHCSLVTLFPTLKKEEIVPLDLSVSSSWLGPSSEFNNLDWFSYQLGQIQKANQEKVIAGGYLESRPLYTATTYDKIGNEGPEHRCMHLGIDFWVLPNTPVHAIYSGQIVVSVNDEGDKKYGGLIILRHEEKDLIFYTLYGHLAAKSVAAFKVGDHVRQGDQIGLIGNSLENGNWSPHLHFQLMLSLLNFKNDFPGVAYFKEKKTWESLCPNPNLLFKLKGMNVSPKSEKKDLLKSRQHNLGRGMSLQYDSPLHIVRGSGAFLIDENGKNYLDTVNNVAHVGHEHPRVVKAGQQQMGLLNTNTRYLHKNITQLAEKLKQTLPPKLSVIHFVNSGSEANELALRMVKTVSGSKHMLVSQVGYHGNTNGCIEISSYKFDGKGGNGPMDHIHVFPIPDSFRGKYRGDTTAMSYAHEIELLIQNLIATKKKLGGFIIEPILSCGGQIELPEGFLKKVYSMVRKAGGLCISDEVQTGCGRMGKVFWGFQLHDVVPDIITIGKPLGNGHPVAAVACTQEVAEKFANGMEYFNTFGGNPVSCAIAKEVLQVVEDEGLQKNALEVGAFLKSGLQDLAKTFPIIGSVRGQGLFLGVELVSTEGKPLPNQAKYLVNRMKKNGILMSTDGPDNNVLKIKPPIVFSIENAKTLLGTLTLILNEDLMKMEQY